MTAPEDTTMTDRTHLDLDLDLDRLVPLGVLVAEGLDETVDQLAGRIGDDVFLDDIGLRCCTASTARALIAEREARGAAERERAARVAAREAACAAQRDEEVRAERERMRLIAEYQAKNGGGLVGRDV